MNVRNLLKIRNFTPPFLLALAACSGEVDNPLANGPVALGVTAEIGQVMSRAQTTSFETNDAIGVIPEQAAGATGAAAQYQFNYAGSGFTAQGTQYYFADTNEKTFHAYYPYTEAVSTDAAITLDTRADNQVVDKTESGVAWRKNDYLAATTTASASSPTATYTGSNAFHHVMAQVVLKFQAGGGLTDLQPLTSYTLTTPLAMDGTFSPATGAVTLDETKATETLTMSGLGQAADGKVVSTLILLPQSVADGTLGLDVTYNGQTYRAALTIPAPETEAGATPALTAGTSYAYTVTISQNGLSVDKAEIQDWNTQKDEVVALPVPPIGNKPLAEADWGDFYFSDGTFADKEAELTDAQKAACIGIVFGVGMQEYDWSDYSQTGIKQADCHGYVVALTDAHQGEVGLKWADGGAEEKYIDGFDDISSSYSGYAMTQAIRAYAEEEYGKYAPDYFPAAYACLQYGEPEGPEWTHRFAAPSSSSGWFLPAYMQLTDLALAASTVQDSFTKLQEALSGDTSIGWFSEASYWSSEQRGASEAVYEYMSGGYPESVSKSTPCRVRAILAF